MPENPTIEVDDKGTILSYLDSGSIENQVYTTFIIIHGGNWYNGIFRRIMDLAPHHGLRLICLNRRDFPGSTPYSLGELEPIRDGDDHEVFKAFRIARGHEINRFIFGIIERENIPPVRRGPDGIKGGIALMGWSLGNAFGFATIAHMNSMAPTYVELLRKYVHTYVAFDVSHFILSSETPVEAPPAGNQSLPPQGLVFGDPSAFKYQSSYFAHEINEDAGTYKLAMEPIPGIPPTVERMTSEEVKSCLPKYLPQSENLWRSAGSKGGFAQDTHVVLFPPDSDQCLQVKWVYCENSQWHIIWAAFKVKAELERLGSRATVDPGVEVIRVREGNHFLHWDDPVKMLAVLRRCLDVPGLTGDTT